jgi:hypothetical protein
MTSSGFRSIVTARHRDRGSVSGGGDLALCLQLVLSLGAAGVIRE